MLWLRSLLFYLFGFTTVIIVASAIILVIPFTSRSARYQMGVFWCRLTQKALLFFCGINIKIKGFENIPREPNKSLIILGKHQSAWETFIYPAFFPRQLCFVFKRELLFVPFFGWALASLKMIHINRGDREKAREAVNEQGKVVLSDGNWIAIYPEGTRTPRGSFKPYRKGGVRLAISTQTDILPVAQNSAAIWPRNTFLKHPGVITLSIGPVISVAGKTEDQLQLEVETWIEGEMRRIDAPAYTN
ncbi:1-acyl-sn-glycerol-3-phosphate acyltransferase [Polynucleobacter sp. AP-Kaivos-20-H2]|uniref:lysophospholipid acyltransferase family protein n=1 Tax=Polynucleobacter sp. AP-Kaivos-20-H2 TaxID=2689104 RepID=UPI001C0E7F8E|nr:lysophospholipid acyltransferase family protein [Polynucleobacter sp. AP-Kaivos-20-H2]MBU3603122.1 1-acyl-sn-glycerol-3-phosphate acyltransferase [Polynucleobacter sp. AP-Kaivos-20-H2]